MSKIITLVWLATVIVVALVVVSPAAAQPVVDPYPQAYRNGAAYPAARPVSPQQHRSSPNQPVRDVRPEANAYAYDGDPYTTGRAYEVSGAADGSGYGNPAVPRPGGRLLPSYQPPYNYDASGHGNQLLPWPGDRPLPSYQQPYNHPTPGCGNPSVPARGGRVSERMYPYNYDAPDYDGSDLYPMVVGSRPNAGGRENGFWRLKLMGCDVVAADGTFLGRVSLDYNDPQSLSNVNGPYGNPNSALSIYNSQGQYGDVRSPLSVWNVSTRTPPAYYDRGQFKGYLTSNRALSPRVGPVLLAEELGLQSR